MIDDKTNTDESLEISDEEFLSVLALAQDVRAIEQEKIDKAKVEANGLLYYKPHPKQDLFHRAGGFKRRYLRAGNRFGKSDMGAAETVAFMLGYRPWIPEGDPDRYVGIPEHAVKGVLVCQDWDKSEEIFTSREEGERKGKLFKFIPKDALVRVDKRQTGHISKIVVKSIWGGNSSLYIETVRSFKQDGMSLESSDWDFGHFDEPLPKKMFEAISRGFIDRGGSCWFVCTPLNELWINDYFFSGNQAALLESPEVVNGRWMMTGSSRDNPYTNKEGLDEFFNGLDEKTRMCRENGIPLQLTGRVYSEFDEELHLIKETPHGWKDKYSPPKGYTIRYAVDPHPSTPHAVLFAATSPQGYTYFFQEFFNQVLISDVAEFIKQTVKDHYVQDAILDPLGFILSPVDNTSMADEFDACGVYMEKAPKDLQRGILKVKSVLNARDAKGRPMVYFMDHLEETRFEFERYIWDEKKENKPIDKNDHMMENLYRLCINGLDYVDPTKYNDVYVPHRQITGHITSKKPKNLIAQIPNEGYNMLVL